MKKRISLLVAVAMLMSAFVSMVTVVSAATSPEIVISATEVDFSDAAYSSYAGDYDWSEYNEDAVGEYKTYDVAVKLKGLELSTESYKSGKSTKYKGTSLISALLNFSIDAGDATYDEDWKLGIISTLVAGATRKATTTELGVGDANASAVYPAPSTAVTVAATDETPAIFHALVTIDTGKPITFTASNADIIIGTFNSDTSAAMADSTTEYAKDAGTFSVSGVSLTLPLGPSTTAVTGVTMAPKALNLKVGESSTVTGTVAPSDATDKTVTYSSSNTSVATVDASTGLVTAVAKGTATITVTTTDGGKTDTCAVTVAPADVVPAAADSKVVGNETTGLKDADGKSVTIDASRSYGAAKFDNVQIDAGDYIYKVVAKDSNGNEKEFDVASEYLEVSGKASFIAIVRSATHTITSVVLKAFKKGE